jgi:lactate dehydrogenase-like 2-hydroxyacid dehydrogenase
MAKEVVEYSLKMFIALVRNLTYGIVLAVNGIFPWHVPCIGTMQVLFATDIRHSNLGSGLIGMDNIDYTLFM